MEMHIKKLVRIHDNKKSFKVRHLKFLETIMSYKPYPCLVCSNIQIRPGYITIIHLTYQNTIKFVLYGPEYLEIFQRYEDIDEDGYRMDIEIKPNTPKGNIILLFDSRNGLILYKYDTESLFVPYA